MERLNMASRAYAKLYVMLGNGGLYGWDLPTAIGLIIATIRTILKEDDDAGDND